MKLIRKLREEFEYRMELILVSYEPDSYDPDTRRHLPRPFPSVSTAIFRFLLKYCWIVIPAIWAVLMIICLVKWPSLLDLILIPLLGTALILAAIVAALFVLMAVEGFLRCICTPLFYNVPAFGSENEVDGFIAFILRGF